MTDTKIRFGVEGADAVKRTATDIIRSLHEEQEGQKRTSDEILKISEKQLASMRRQLNLARDLKTADMERRLSEAEQRKVNYEITKTAYKGNREQDSEAIKGLKRAEKAYREDSSEENKKEVEDRRAKAEDAIRRRDEFQKAKDEYKGGEKLDKETIQSEEKELKRATKEDVDQLKVSSEILNIIKLWRLNGWGSKELQKQLAPLVGEGENAEELAKLLEEKHKEIAGEDEEESKGKAKSLPAISKGQELGVRAASSAASSAGDIFPGSTRGKAITSGLDMAENVLTSGTTVGGTVAGMSVGGPAGALIGALIGAAGAATIGLVTKGAKALIESNNELYTSGISSAIGATGGTKAEQYANLVQADDYRGGEQYGYSGMQLLPMMKQLAEASGGWEKSRGDLKPAMEYQRTELANMSNMTSLARVLRSDRGKQSMEDVLSTNVAQLGDGEWTQSNERLGILVELAQKQLAETGSVNTKSIGRVLASLQGIGGTLSNLETAGKVAGNIQKGLQDAPTDQVQALQFEVLSKIKPNASLWDLEMMKENGYQGEEGEKYLAGMLDMLKKIAGDDKAVLAREIFNVFSGLSKGEANDIANNQRGLVETLRKRTNDVSPEQKERVQAEVAARAVEATSGTQAVEAEVQNWATDKVVSITGNIEAMMRRLLAANEEKPTAYENAQEFRESIRISEEKPSTQKELERALEFYDFYERMIENSKNGTETQKRAIAKEYSGENSLDKKLAEAQRKIEAITGETDAAKVRRDANARKKVFELQEAQINKDLEEENELTKKDKSLSKDAKKSKIKTAQEDARNKIEEARQQSYYVGQQPQQQSQPAFESRTSEAIVSIANSAEKLNNATEKLNNTVTTMATTITDEANKQTNVNNRNSQ